MGRTVVPAAVVLAVSSATVLLGVAPPAEMFVGAVRSHTVAAGDTLGALGARFGIDVATLAHDNGIRADGKLAVGQTLVLDNRHIVPAHDPAADIVINVPQRMLFNRREPGAAFPVAVGRSDWRTPIGAFTVVLREEDPTWDVPESIAAEARRQGRELPKRVLPGPSNPLGAFWIGLSGGGIGLHGTNAPASIYRAATHGCIRLHPDDIAWLFPRVALGARIEIVYLPVLLVRDADRVFLEVHRDVYRRTPRLLDEAYRIAAALGVTDRIDWRAAADVVARAHGIARDVTARQPPP